MALVSPTKYLKQLNSTKKVIDTPGKLTNNPKPGETKEQYLNRMRRLQMVKKSSVMSRREFLKLAMFGKSKFHWLSKLKRWGTSGKKKTRREFLQDAAEGQLEKGRRAQKLMRAAVKAGAGAQVGRATVKAVEEKSVSRRGFLKALAGGTAASVHASAPARKAIRQARQARQEPKRRIVSAIDKTMHKVQDAGQRAGGSTGNVARARRLIEAAAEKRLGRQLVKEYPATAMKAVPL